MFFDEVETLALAKKYTDKKVASGGAGNAVTITENSSSAYAKIYTIKQGGTTIGTINIPKDMVVQSGQLVENPEGQAAGKYIELTLANSDNTKIYISVSDLIDIYTPQANATQIQLAINNNVISASIVKGSVGLEELSTTLKNTLNTYSLHIDKNIVSEEGAHGLRYFNNTLQYNDKGTWKTINIGELLI